MQSLIPILGPLVDFGFSKTGKGPKPDKGHQSLASRGMVYRFGKDGRKGVGHRWM
jgi:hypothetical protein